MSNYNQALILEAVRELNIISIPSLYKRIKRLARKYIKHQLVEPIDNINWPKGCLAVGLMDYGMKRLSDASGISMSAEAPSQAIYAISEVKTYLDMWISSGTNIYFVDDCLMGQALLKLALYYRDIAKDESLYEKYMSAADKMMEFLFAHRQTEDGSLPYRPNQTTNDIYADGIGMVVPFAIGYGYLRGNDDAIALGMTQLRNFVKNATDTDTGLFYHTYRCSGSRKDDSGQGRDKDIGDEKLDGDSDIADKIFEISKALGWGRALGWVTYGAAAGLAIANRVLGTPVYDDYTRELKQINSDIQNLVMKYRRENCLWGSDLLDPDSPIDTSASAMIMSILDGEEFEKSRDELKKYITEDGRVMQAQGECMGVGIYSTTFDSYPWSVGMTLAVL